MNRCLLILLVGLTLASCSERKHYRENDKLDTYVTSVSKTKRTHTLSIKDDKISKADIAAIDALSRDLVHTGVKQIEITPVITQFPISTTYAKSIDKIKQLFMKAGINKSSIHVLEPVIDQEQGIIIDSYIYKLSLPTAKKWKYAIGDIDLGKELPNIGVSAEYNIGVMIANPKDLVEPDPMGNVDAKSAIAASKKSTGKSGSSSSPSSSSSSSGMSTVSS